MCDDCHYNRYNHRSNRNRQCDIGFSVSGFGSIGLPLGSFGSARGSRSRARGSRRLLGYCSFFGGETVNQPHQGIENFDEGEEHAGTAAEYDGPDF